MNKFISEIKLISRNTLAEVIYYTGFSLLIKSNF